MGWEPKCVGSGRGGQQGHDKIFTRKHTKKKTMEEVPHRGGATPFGILGVVGIG